MTGENSAIAAKASGLAISTLLGTLCAPGGVISYQCGHPEVLGRQFENCSHWCLYAMKPQSNVITKSQLLSLSSDSHRKFNGTVQKHWNSAGMPPCRTHLEHWGTHSALNREHLARMSNPARDDLWAGVTCLSRQSSCAVHRFNFSPWKCPSPHCATYRSTDPSNVLHSSCT